MATPSLPSELVSLMQSIADLVDEQPIERSAWWRLLDEPERARLKEASQWLRATANATVIELREVEDDRRAGEWPDEDAA